MPISFAFKTNVSIRLVTVSIPKEPNPIFQQIPNIERKYEQFYLLPKVDALVIEKNHIFSKRSMLQNNKGPKRYS